MKADGRPTRCSLNSTIRDVNFAILCACGSNIPNVQAHLRAVLALFIAAIPTAIQLPRPIRSCQKQPKRIVQAQLPDSSAPAPDAHAAEWWQTNVKQIRLTSGRENGER